jgi:hypothetical protein
MSPHEMDRHRDEFDRAIARIGWAWRTVRRDHERDEGYRDEDVLVGPDGRFLTGRSDLSEGLVREIIRMAGLLPRSTEAPRAP